MEYQELIKPNEKWRTPGRCTEFENEALGAPIDLHSSSEQTGNLECGGKIDKVRSDNNCYNFVRIQAHEVLQGSPQTPLGSLRNLVELWLGTEL